MRSALEICASRGRSEGGFVLIAALLAVMIIIAVGFFILTTTTQDIRISSRLIGERKALSAAETGMQMFCLNFATDMSAVSNQSVDSTNDPYATYSYTVPSRDKNVSDIPAVGSDMKSGSWSYAVYDSDITGKETTYSSSVTIEVGVTYGPVSPDTVYR